MSPNQRINNVMPYSELFKHNRFVLCKYVPSKKRPGKIDKFPLNPDTLEVSDAHDPKNWLSGEIALNTSNALGDEYGIGFVFTEDLDLFFIDIDGCVTDGMWSPVAKTLMERFNGCLIEVSHSQKGLHIVGKYSGAEPDHGCKNIPLGLELYTSGRFMALGNMVTAVGDASLDFTEKLLTTITEYYPNDPSNNKVVAEWTKTHDVASNPITDDDALIEKALSTRSASSVFGGGGKATFKDLWTKNEEALTDAFPDDLRGWDRSSADAALAQHLSFWCGGNCERIDQLMRKSALVRDKWDYHKSYINRTVGGAVGRSSQFYSVGAPIEIAEHTERATLREGYQFMGADQMMEYFAGCVYICDIHRIWSPNGSLLKSEQFNAMYGGYVFALDASNDKTTKKAFEAFTESQCVNFPKADGMTFKPQIDAGAIITLEQQRLVNTYVPIDIDMTPGDITPFTTHMNKILPDETDQTILMSYMASCIQHKGYKIQWTPLIQGVEGNGKTLFTRCVAYSVGKRYTHMPKASELDSKFNGWMVNKLFYGVEDIYVADHKNEILETLKPMITGGDGIEIQGKGADQTTRDICGNFIMNSNHKDAVRKTQNDRRFCVFYTAQQDEIDIIRDGMGGDYFPELYNWLNNGGYAHVAHHLNNYVIPEKYNPTTKCQRAPETSSTREAIELSMGSIEQEILEAIEEGQPGFANGWVSSFALDELIERVRIRIPRKKRRDIMKTLGYDWHPNLNSGRVNHAIAFTGSEKSGKPRLYIKQGHIHQNLMSPVEIARCYCTAQGDLITGNTATETFKNG